MLSELHISNFRSFANLEFNNLGRVNLIVGKNNAGKTSLLEAITILSQPQLINNLPGLYRASDGPVGPRFYRWIRRDGCGTADTIIESGSPNSQEREALIIRSIQTANNALPFIVGGSIGNEYLMLAASRAHKTVRVTAVSVNHRSPEAMVGAFSEAVRPKEGERLMEKLLNAVDSRIQGIRLDADKDGRSYIVIDLGLTERVPLAQAGQGVYRLVNIFSELLGQRPKIFLIDEIENGIHYTALPDVWKGINEIAKTLDVQIFATTHSLECVVAAEKAFAAADSANDLRVIQLYRIGDATEGRVLDGKHISSAIEAEIELR